MIFTPNQIRELMSIIDKNTMIFIANNLGKSVLSDEDLKLLKQFGITPEKIPNIGIVDTSYKFGILTQALGPDKIKGLTYGELKNMLRANTFLPLNARERFTVESIKRQSFSDIKGLGDRIKGDVANLYDKSLTDVRTNYEDIIRDSAVKMVEQRKSIKWMTSEIGHATKRWGRDFDKIADYISHQAFDEGRIAAIEKEKGEDAKIYKDVYKGACAHCIRLYLTAGIGSKPKIFTIAELVANGSNIGRKSSELKPVIGPTHPFCRCTSNHLEDGYEWDEEKKEFVLSDNWERKVQRRSKVRVTVGDKTTEI